MSYQSERQSKFNQAAMVTGALATQTHTYKAAVSRQNYLKAKKMAEGFEKEGLNVPPLIKNALGEATKEAYMQGALGPKDLKSRFESEKKEFDEKNAAKMAEIEDKMNQEDYERQQEEDAYLSTLSADELMAEMEAQERTEAAVNKQRMVKQKINPIVARKHKGGK